MEKIKEKPSETITTRKSEGKMTNILKVISILFIFLVSLSLMSSGFKLVGKEFATHVMQLTSNPFIGLFVGVLATSLVQSSSTVTTMIVAIVASGTLPLSSAVPMIMGANIGTSVTSTIVALAHISDKNEFNKALSAATVHDFFNIIVVCILFPIEYFTGALSQAGAYLAYYLSEALSFESKSKGILDYTVKPVAKWLMNAMNNKPMIIIGASLVLLILSLRALTKVLKNSLVGNSQKKFEKYLFGSPLKSLFWGTAITSGVQSSSVTSSLTVPLVASEKLSLKQAFPFLMGANIGTTVTALIAAISQNEVAIAIALCHFLFNLFGVLILFPIPFFRNVPIKLAETLGSYSKRNKFVGVAYILVTFFLVPFSLIYLTT